MHTITFILYSLKTNYHTGGVTWWKELRVSRYEYLYERQWLSIHYAHAFNRRFLLPGRTALHRAVQVHGQRVIESANNRVIDSTETIRTLVEHGANICQRVSWCLCSRSSLYHTTLHYTRSVLIYLFIYYLPVPLWRTCSSPLYSYISVRHTTSSVDCIKTKFNITLWSIAKTVNSNSVLQCNMF